MFRIFRKIWITLEKQNQNFGKFWKQTGIFGKKWKNPEDNVKFWICLKTNGEFWKNNRNIKTKAKQNKKLLWQF